MNTSESKRTIKPSATARAEAAAWLARLHGPNRTREVEAGFRRWMAEDPERAAAFELLTDTWEKSARLRRRPFEHVASWQLPGFRLSFSRAAFATMAIAVLAVISTVFYIRSDGLATAIGEQRTLTFEDGTRVYLNTDTRLEQRYEKAARRVELKRGEALFEVAKRPDWPFIVTAGDKQVRALGTAFVVRRDEQNLAVTLVEGKITVSPVALTHTPEPFPLPVPDAGTTIPSESPEQLANSTPPSSAPSTRERNSGRSTEQAEGEVVTLSPGQRLSFTSTGPPQLDMPSIDRVTAWQRGQVALDNTPLVEAIAEMNRYSTVRLTIESQRIAAIPISGIFRAGDSNNFARAVARTYHLNVIDRRNEILLTE